MKKYLSIILLILVLFSGCSLRKNVYSFDKFQEYTITNEYQFTDITDQVDNKNIIEAGMASTSTWHIEYYHLNNKEEALKMFNYNKSTFENSTKVKSLQLESTGLNYNYYSLTTNKTFMYVCQVDDTLIYASVPVEYRKKVLKFIQNMGY